MMRMRREAKQPSSEVEHPTFNRTVDGSNSSERTKLFDDDVVAAIDHIKQELRAEILRDALEGNMGPSELARRTGLAQPDASELMRGQLVRFSVERLIAVLVQLGHDPRVLLT